MLSLAGARKTKGRREEKRTEATTELAFEASEAKKNL